MSNSESSDYDSDLSYASGNEGAKSVSSTASIDSNSLNSGAKSKSASDQYQRLSQLEHILKRPDTYIGSIEKTPMEMWCFDADSGNMVFKEVKIVPGLFKIFDEILVNAADNKIRDPNTRNIKVKIDVENSCIEVMNDGKGIPIEIHKKENMYIPELIFGNLLTSSNYDDDDKKVTGGRNGYGAKLCNIYSVEFHLETADLSSKSVYKQTWTDNMSQVSKPKITKMKNNKEYTKITFRPDLKKFGMSSLDEDLLSVLRRRVYDLCGTVKNCNIFLNDEKIAIKNFKGYVDMYVKSIRQNSLGEGVEQTVDNNTIAYEAIDDRCEVAFALSDGSFNQVSFVNSIATTSGGTHVKYIADQIVSKLSDALEKTFKSKRSMFKPQDVRNNMFLFVNCLIENPAFTSQTKEQLTTRASQFSTSGKKLIVSDSFIKKVLKTGIVARIEEIMHKNSNIVMSKADGSKKSRIKNQAKLVDANKAGTKLGHQCTLILTEGLSALSLAVEGLSVVGRNFYGCFPLKGKLLNVREASVDQVSKNVEINALKQIIGLKHGKHYTAEDIKSLRYGRIMLMTDQDQDGSHIKGLIINFFDSSFPGLLQIPGFLLEFITPIVKVTIRGRGAQSRVIPFYTMPQFEEWRATEGVNLRWSHKYYKGLGTSSPVEMREYFAALDRHLKHFDALQADDKQYIDLAFSKSKVDDRKAWLQALEPGTHLDPNLSVIPISDFINKELILFSMADNVRSIPSVLDGLKPGQRKVLFGCLKRNLVNEIKVTQLAGYVSEKTSYHHAEDSLSPTIIGMAQDFIGSNNLNLLNPNGGFGSRAAGGKDYSAPRYLFTELNKITKFVFNPLDEPLYHYLQEDSDTVEPEWYVPVLPMILVNGAEGIGTAWSTNIPQFNPVDIVANIKRLLDGEEMIEMSPWYKGWNGIMEKESEMRYRVKGIIEQTDESTLEITEIPVKTWTNNVKEFLLNGINNEKGKPWIKDFEEQHDVNIRFVIKLSQEEMAKSNKIGLLERFKLNSTISYTNMVAFDPQGHIKRYSSPLGIIRDFFYIRLEYYQRRKDYMAESLRRELIKLSEQARFIKLIIENTLSVSNKARSILVNELNALNFAKIDKTGKIINGSDTEVDGAQTEQFDDEVEDIHNSSATAPPAGDQSEGKNSFYDYLLGMPIWSLTKERYEKLIEQENKKNQELITLLAKTPKDLWIYDLNVFLEQWQTFLELDMKKKTMAATDKPNSKKKRGKTARKPTNKKQKVVKAESDKEKTPDSERAENSTMSVKKENFHDEIPSFFDTSSLKTSSKQKSKKLVSKFDDDDDIYELPISSQRNSLASENAKEAITTHDMIESRTTRPQSEKRKAGKEVKSSLIVSSDDDGSIYSEELQASDDDDEYQ